MRLRIIYLPLLVILLSAGLLTYHYLSSSSIIRIRVTTTTSLYATGLLEKLSSKYSERHPNVVFDYIPVGSGEALERAARGDACMVFVHAPLLEKKYIDRGVLEYHRIFAYNYFIIAGPMNDPAGVKRASDPIDAFKRIYRACEDRESIFISRGDNSGTHVKELSIWQAAGLDPRGRNWYLETGSGMGETLIVANEKKGYVLSDIGTFLKFKKEGRLNNIDSLYAGGEELINIYSVYLVKGCKYRDIVIDFINFIMGPGQDIIREYGVYEYGSALFYPAINNMDYLTDLWYKLSG